MGLGGGVFFLCFGSKHLLHNYHSDGRENDSRIVQAILFVSAV